MMGNETQSPRRFLTPHGAQFCMFGNVFPTGKMLVKSGKITAGDYPCTGVRLLNSDAQVRVMCGLDI
jgi:hypothetical protein